MPDIKSRDMVKGTIKTLDRSAVLGERMKEAYVRTKEKAGNAASTSDSSVNENGAGSSATTSTPQQIAALALAYLSAQASSPR